MDYNSGDYIAEGWSTDSCKSVFGQLIVSDARALQSTLKMQIFDLPLSKFPVGFRHVFLHTPHDLAYIRLKFTQN